MSVSQWWMEPPSTLQDLLHKFGFESSKKIPAWMIASGIAAGVGLVTAGYLYTKPAVLLKLLLRYKVKTSGFRVTSVRGTYTYPYMERGSRSDNRLSLVFVDGGGGQKENWLQLLELIPRDLHVVCMDLPSQGDAEVPTDLNDATMLRLTDFLDEVVCGLSMNKKKFHLVGLSMGGLIACMYTAIHPHRVAKLTTICPSVPCPIETEYIQEFLAGANFLDRCKTPEGLRQFLMSLYYNKNNLPKHQWIYRAASQIFKEVTPVKRRFDDAVVDNIRKSMLEKEKVEELLAKMVTPVQIVWGENDAMLHVSGASYLEEVIPTVTRTDIIPECGHPVYIDAAPSLHTVLMQFYHSDAQSTDL